MRSEISPIRAFLYARSATEAQDTPSARADEQLQRLRRYAHARSYVVVGEAQDVARSGASLTRPGLEMVMREATCSPPTFDVLLATDLPRLARGMEVFQAITSRLAEASIQIEFADSTYVWVDEAAREGQQAALQELFALVMERDDEED